MCAPCHLEETDRWRGSHHDLSMQVADEATVLGDFGGAVVRHLGVTSTFSRRDGRFFVRTEGPDGALRGYEIAYTFGADPLQQYLIRFPKGRLQALGIAWDNRPESEGGQRWVHLYPDERIAPGDPLHWTGLNQTWNFMCAECHSTNLLKGYQADGDRYETTWSEIDVSCEACHGPGRAHVTWGEAVARGERSASDRDKGLVVELGRGEGTWILDAAGRTAERSTPLESSAEIEACARCHSRRSVIRDPYVWGQPLMETHLPALLEPDLYHSDGQILDEVYVYGSFLQSRMYARGVTCSDCHDAHSLTTADDPDSVCDRCHRPDHFRARTHHFHEPGSSGAQCLACHMPARTYMVVDPRRDHSFRIPRPDLDDRLGTPDACTACHSDRSTDWAAQAVEQWYGPDARRAPHFGEALEAARASTPDATRALLSLVEDRTQPAIARATALRLLRDRRSPATPEVASRALRDADPLVRAAALQAIESVAPPTAAAMASPLLRDPVRGVRIGAAVLIASIPRSAWPAPAPEGLAKALDEYREAQLANADRPEAHLNLGVLHVQDGDLDGALAEYETALRLAPSFVPAYVNLADLYRLQGRDGDGERLLRRGLALAPEDADLHHALGLNLARQRRTDEAIDSLGRASRLAPDRARLAYAYGVALHSSGRTEAALAVLEHAHERRPGNVALLQALATMSRDLGRLPSALAYARKLVEVSEGDPTAERLLEQILDEAGGD